MSETKIYDAAIVGGGHNGLTCACYLAQAGLKTIVLERRHIVGGAVCTEDDLIKGYKIDTGSSAHIMIHLTPVVRELELEKFGLEYIECDPFAFAPVSETEAIYFWRDVEKTCDSIARVSPRDADAYRKFVREWGELNEGVFEAFLKPPTPFNLARHLIFKRTREQPDPVEMTRKLFSSYGQLARETFEHEGLRAALVWLAAQSGPPPSAQATGDFLGWHATIHRSGVKRPRGGSGALTQSLARCLESHSGEVRLSAEVARIEVEKNRATGIVELQNGERIVARRIISNAHVQTTFLKLIGAENLPDNLAKRVTDIRVGNGFGMIVRCAMKELPNYICAPSNNQIAGCHKGLQLLCPSTEYLERAYTDFLRGRPSENPAAVVMTFSAVDPTLAPEGKHTMFVWGQYYPFELSDGESWDDIQEREADKLIEVVARYAPNVRAAIIERFVQSPLDLERRFGLLRGNVMHVEMDFTQMFLFRPLPELAAYRTPFENLYLTGASTHPGGGVFAASGRNTAEVVLADAARDGNLLHRIRDVATRLLR